MSSEPEPNEVLPEAPRVIAPESAPTKESEADETYPESEMLH